MKLLQQYRYPILGAAIIGIACIAILLIMRRHDGPSLTETLSWMDSTYNDHATAGGSYGYGILEWSDPNGRKLRYETESFTYHGCQITMKHNGNLAEAAYNSDAPEEVYLIDLKTIDPDSLRAFRYYSGAAGISCDAKLSNYVCDSEQLEFHVHNDEPLIQRTERRKGKKTERADKTYFATWIFNDVSYARKFEIAFHHAITLCGGTHSTF